MDSRPTQPGRRPLGLWHVVALLCGLGVAFTLILPFAAVASARQLSVSTTDSPMEIVALDPNRPSDLGVRALPLLSPDTEAAVTPDGLHLDQTVVEQEAQRLAEHLGFDWDELSHMLAASNDSALTPDISIAGEWVYPRFEVIYILKRGIDKVMAADPTSVADLASLLLLSGAQSGARMALALLLSGDLAEHDCGIATNLAFAIQLTNNYPPSEIDKAAAQAVSVCGDDPTALWVSANAGYSEIGVNPLSDCQSLAQPGPHLPDNAISAAHALQQKYPDMAAGYVAEAELIAVQAMEEARYNLRPFTVRQRWKQVDALLNEAQKRSASDEIVLARARAQAGLGSYSKSAELAASVEDSRLEFDGMRMLAAQVFSQNRDFESAYSVTQHAPALVGGQRPRTRTLVWRTLTNSANTAGHLTSSTVSFNSGMAYRSMCGAGPSWAFDGGVVPVARVASVTQGAPDSPIRSSTAVPPAVRPSPAELSYLAGSSDATAHECATNDPARLGICATVTSPDSAESRYSEQDLLRAAGRFDDAATLLLEWLEEHPEDATMWSQLGEIRLLQQNLPEAIASFQAALSSPSMLDEWAQAHWQADQSAAWVRLRLGYAYQSSGNFADAHDLYSSVTSYRVRKLPFPQPEDRNAIGYYQDSLLAGLSAELGDYEQAYSHWQNAVDSANLWRAQAIYDATRPPAGGVAEQNAALAASRLGAFDEAISFADAAVALDENNPLYLETLAEAKRGQIVSAGAHDDMDTEPDLASAENADDLIASYREILLLDDSLFSSWNNLGVLLSLSGEHDEAREAFTHAVQSRPEYALGWFNLGSELILNGGWRDAVVGEGALGLATKYDRDLKGLAPGLTFDDEIYASGLDLSKVLPADWNLGGSARPPSAPLTAALVALVALRLGFDLFKDNLAGSVVEKALRRSSTGRWRRFLWLPAWIGVLGSLVVLTVRSGAGTITEMILVAPLMTSLVVLPTAIRRLGHSESVQDAREATPVMGIASSAVLAGFGVPWPPLPYSSNARAGRACVLVSAVLAGVCMLLMIPAAWTLVPVAGLGSAAAAATLGALLVPVPPAEGAYLPRVEGRVATVFLFAVTVLQSLGVV